MSFTAPGFLWALPLAALPLLVHFLARRRALRVRFSDLSFLRRVYSRAKPLSRLEQWLLLAARCLLLLCLVLGFAGPILEARGGGRGEAGEGLDLALLLDVSYSMGARELGKTRLELAREEASALVRGLSPLDRVAVALFSDRLESPQEGLRWLSRPEALESLAWAQLGFRGTDYAPALRAAAGLLAREPGRRRAALLLSDGARHGLRGPLPELGEGVFFLGLRWPRVPDNAYLLWAGPDRESSPRAPRLSARAAGLRGRAPTDLGGGTSARYRAVGRASIELWDQERRLSSALWPLGAVSAQGEAGKALTLELPARPVPAWWGRAVLQPDVLSADDAYFYSFRHPARPKLLCLYGQPAFFKAPRGGYFLKEILGGAREGLLDYDADFLELWRASEARLSDYRVVVLADFKELPQALAGELERFVRRGGGLWVLPGAEAGPEAFASLNPWLPAQYGLLVAGEGSGIQPGPGADPKLWREFELQRVAVTRYYLLQVRPGSEVAFKSASGYPLLVSGPHGEGRAAVWASSLETAWGNLAVKPAFAVWVKAVLDDLLPPSERLSETFDLKVGEPLVRTWSSGEPAPPSVRLRDPEGRGTTLWTRGRRVEYAATSRPGLYTLTEEGTGRRSVYAVNLDRSSGESELALLETAPWKALDVRRVAEDFRLQVHGRDARAGVLAAAAALLLVEMLLSLPRSLAGLLLLVFLAGPARAQPGGGDRLAWAQLKLGPDWDPYPGVHTEVLGLMATVTSVLVSPERRVLTLRDQALFSSPILVLVGRQAPPELEAEERQNLRRYLSAGGLLWIEDVSGSAVSSFDRWVRRLLPATLPESELSPLEPGHVLFKSFFLLRGVSGRVMVRGSLEGVSWAGRTAVVYSRNDLLGVWLKDALGQPLYPCLPGGEPQRHNARKLALNILMYALTGSYKADAVHQPFLLQKMSSGAP